MPHYLIAIGLLILTGLSIFAGWVIASVIFGVCHRKPKLKLRLINRNAVTQFIEPPKLLWHVFEARCRKCGLWPYAASVPEDFYHVRCPDCGEIAFEERRLADVKAITGEEAIQEGCKVYDDGRRERLRKDSQRLADTIRSASYRVTTLPLEHDKCFTSVGWAGRVEAIMHSLCQEIDEELDRICDKEGDGIRLTSLLGDGEIKAGADTFFDSGWD